MNISLQVNGVIYHFTCPVSETMLVSLRRLGFFSVKFGDEHGFSGADTILMDGKPVNAGLILTAQAEGHRITTVEALGIYPHRGWIQNRGFHPLQQAFISCGAIQCGYCTPAQILAAKSLLDNNPDPTELEIREAISGVLCRCTGYEKPVKAILHAAALMRGDIQGLDVGDMASSLPIDFDPLPLEDHPQPSLTKVISKPRVVQQKERYKVIGKSEPKVDAAKLVQGKPAFTADFDIRGLLHAKVLRSPYAHARIKHIDASRARDLKGVAAVLTWQDIPRVVYSTAGQSDPIPGPLDNFSLDYKVRFVGDRVAFIAAETPEIAETGLNLIDVDYEVLPAVMDMRQSMEIGAPIIHDESEYTPFAECDPKRNLAAEIRIDIGNVEKGFLDADRIFEGDYIVPKVQQAHIEPYVTISYWDEDDRLVIRTSTQVPFHARRVLASILDLPVKRIRVIKPRIGGGFGGKQEILVEDVAAHLTIATGHPVKYETTREEVFTASRSRHPMRIHMKTGVKYDGTMTANEMHILSDTGAYGCHALTVTGNTGHKSMGIYVGDKEYRNSPNIRFYADIVYTNTPPSGAYRGYGVPQGYWPLDRHFEKIAHSLNLDPLEFRLQNSIRPGEYHPFSTAWNEGREPRPEIINTVGLEECVRKGKEAINWNTKFGNVDWHQPSPIVKKGIGAALVMQGTAIPYLDMGGASIKLNDDGSFNLLVGATDLGTGSDTVLAQMAAEILGVPTEDILVYSSDTDFTPFDKGAYASSTTYISGTAVVKAAQSVAASIKKHAAGILELEDFHAIKLQNKEVVAPDGRSIPLAKIAISSLHQRAQEQIMAVASYVSPSSPPPFGAQFAEVSVDMETGMVTVDKLVMVVDGGTIINPSTASGQVEGGMTQALGYAVCEEMVYNKDGLCRERDFDTYHIFRANEMPELTTIFVETFEPSHPFGVKAVAEIPMDGVAPAVGNAIFDAIGINVDEIPITPEKIWRSLQ